jgi:hypothetical protein
MVASAAYRVRALATTATELAQKVDPVEHLTAQGFRINRSRKPGARPELAFDSRGISYRLLDTANARAFSWQNRPTALLLRQPRESSFSGVTSGGIDSTNPPPFLGSGTAFEARMFS